METIFDWITVLLFAGLITLFLQRSSMEEPPDTVWQYLPPAIACAVVNYLGNEGYTVAAIGVLALAIGYVFKVLRPSVPQ